MHAKLSTPMAPFAVLTALVWFLSPSPALGSGPMTHMMDGQVYLEQAFLYGPSDQTEDVMLIQDTNTERYFLLGTMFPDIRGAIDGLGFDTHDRALGMALLDAAEPYRDTQPWRIAFARGYIQHICTDISAQLFQTQAMTIASGLGDVDLFDGVNDDHPAAENELLVEAGIDLFYGDVDMLLDIVEYFVLDRYQHAARLEQVIDFWWETAHDLYGDGIISQSDLTDQIDAYVRLLTKYQFLIRERMFDLVFARMRHNTLGSLLEDWMTKADKYLSHQPDAQLQMDLDELDRLEDTPMFAERDYLGWYFDDFQWLGPRIHQTFQEDGLWYQDWPVWDWTAMQSTGIQGLAVAWPERFKGTYEIVVFRAQFLDADTGHALDTLPASNPPTLTAHVEVYGTVPVAANVEVRVMRDLPGGYTADEPCGGATTTEFLDMDPADYDQVPRPVLEVTFDPSTCTGGADALYLEVVLADGGNDKPFYTANWEAFDEIPGRDIMQAPYTNLYAPASMRSGYLVISR